MNENYMKDGVLNFLYLDIPLTAKVYYGSGRTRIYGVFGPYIGVGLSGESKYESLVDGETEPVKIDVKWGSRKIEDDFKRLDFGLIVGAGTELNNLILGLTYAHGLANISSNTDGGTVVSHRVLGLSVGYKFGRN